MLIQEDNITPSPIGSANPADLEIPRLWKAHGTYMPDEAELSSNHKGSEDGMGITESIVTAPDNFLGSDLVFRYGVQEHFTTHSFAARRVPPMRIFGQTNWNSFGTDSMGSRNERQ